MDYRYSNNPRDAQLSVTIAAGASLSDAVNVEGATLVSVVVPTGWDTTSTGLTFQASTDGNTYYNVNDKSGEYLLNGVAASRYIVISPLDLTGARYIKVRSGTGASAVSQTAEKVLSLVVRAF